MNVVGAKIETSEGPSELRPSGPGERLNWVSVPIGRVARLRAEKANPKTDGRLTFVGMDDIETDGLEIKRTRPFAEMRSPGNRFWEGDLLYGRLRPYLNKTAVAASEGACSGELLVIEPSEAIDVRYLQYFVHSRRFVNWIRAATSGDRPRASFETLASLTIPLAPLGEQGRIVERIDALFAEIAEGEAALAEARKGLALFRRALLKAAVTGELTRDWRLGNKPTESGAELLARIRARRPQTMSKSGGRAAAEPSSGYHERFALPQGWAWTMLGEITEIVGGVTVDQKRKPDNPVTVPYEGRKCPAWPHQPLRDQDHTCGARCGSSAQTASWRYSAERGR